MPAASLPPDEEARLAALRRYHLMDTPPEAALDALTRQAREICGVPTALISLVDDRRQWFKSRNGLALTETPRSQSFCSHALLTPDQPLIVPDATADARFADNPLVTGDSHIRFYAGVPLCSPEGQPLGTLCVLDTVPRELSTDQLDKLGALAQQTAYQLALRRRGPTERRLAVGFALTLALLLGILGLCFWQANHFLSSDWWVNHTEQVIKDIGEAVSEVQTAESCQRGFSASGQEDFLSSYQQAVDGLPGRLAALRELVKDNPSQVERCDHLAALIERRVVVMGEHIKDRQTLGLGALDAVHMNSRGRRAMAEVMAKAREMVEAENLLWLQRDAARTHDLHVSGLTLLGTGALCVTLLTAGFVVSRRELRRRQALGGSLAQANAGLSTEVAARRRAHASLRESEARFQRIANNVPGMVYRFVQRPDGSLVAPFVSAGCRKVFGLEPRQIQSDGLAIFNSVHPDDQPEFMRTIGASAASGNTWNWQGRIHRADTGEIRYIEGISQPERQGSGDIVWDGVLVDITARRQADDHLRAKEAAERASREKSHFLSRVSHELRTPLNAILGFGQLMELSTLEAGDAESLEYMLKGARHLLSLVDEVLDLSCAETGHLSLMLGRVNVDKVAVECVGLLSPLAQTQNVTCTVQQPASAKMVWCDEQRLRQVLLNLLSNAIKYNHTGGSVLVSCERTTADRLRVKVRDTGPGISPQGMEKLFLPFERLEHEDTRIEGTGLGLAVSRRLAEAMGGTMGVESEVGHGSTFWIELPLAEEPLEAPPILPTVFDVVASNTVASPASAKLLYIEDNESNLHAVKRLLGKLRPQWQLLTADNGARGLELARQNLPDVILLDRQMPGLSGDEVLAELRLEAATEHIPVLMLSADATTEGRDCLLAQGAEDYISKPFQIERLLAAIEKTLANNAVC